MHLILQPHNTMFPRYATHFYISTQWALVSAPKMTFPLLSMEQAQILFFGDVEPRSSIINHFLYCNPIGFTPRTMKTLITMQL